MRAMQGCARMPRLAKARDGGKSRSARASPGGPPPWGRLRRRVGRELRSRFCTPRPALLRGASPALLPERRTHGPFSCTVKAVDLLFFTQHSSGHTKPPRQIGAWRAAPSQDLMRDATRISSLGPLPVDCWLPNTTKSLQKYYTAPHTRPPRRIRRARERGPGGRPGGGAWRRAAL